MSEKKTYSYSLEDMRKLEQANYIEAKQGFTDAELQMFARFCEEQQLDPFNKEAYLMKDKYGKVFTVTNYHVFFKRAQASGTFGGLDEIRYNERRDANGNVIWNTKAELAAAGKDPVSVHCTVYILRGGQRLPVTHSILVSEYDRGNFVWNGKKFTMADKVANAGVMRKAFPEAVAGLYIEEEAGAMEGDTVASRDTDKVQVPRNRKEAKRGADVPTDEQVQAAFQADKLESVMESIAECLSEEPGTCVDALKKLWDDNAAEWKQSTEIKRLVAEARQRGEAIDEMRRCLEDSEPGKHVENLAALWKKNEAAWKKDQVIIDAAKVARQLAEKMDANANKKAPAE